jgi:hypothetical protein
MVQPYLSRIEKEGEVAVIFIGGAYSHSIRRGALLREGRPPDEAHSLPLEVRPYEATPDELALAERVLEQVPGGASGLLYARVDLIPGPHDEPLILEVELAEPSLFLGFGPGSPERLAAAIAAALPRA